ncbi:MAG: hypothetical protein ABIY51_14690 [Ferruginibacter sp.]
MVLLEVTTLHIAIAAAFAAFIAIAWLLAEFKGMKDEIKERLGINNDTIKLRLQAYERLTVYAERSGLKNLVSREAELLQNNSAASLHQAMVAALKSEYDYNASQQIYISTQVWNAVTKLRDQNIYVLNQLAATLPQNASAYELSKVILEYSMTEKAELNTLVLDALKYEVKALLK